MKLQHLLGEIPKLLSSDATVVLNLYETSLSYFIFIITTLLFAENSVFTYCKSVDYENSEPKRDQLKCLELLVRDEMSH